MADLTFWLWTATKVIVALIGVWSLLILFSGRCSLRASAVLTLILVLCWTALTMMHWFGLGYRTGPTFAAIIMLPVVLVIYLTKGKRSKK